MLITVIILKMATAYWLNQISYLIAVLGLVKPQERQSTQSNAKE